MDPPRAITFIEADDREGFRLNPESLQILSSITRPLAIISVVGKYRTGKSFLLNRILLNRKTGFGVGPTINACTKGIWMWSQPMMVETADGEECAVILLDTEGLGALDENANHDTRIFLLALLLASNFIYNSVGSLDEAALNNLSLIVNLTKQLQVRSSVAPQDVDEMSAYFPSLLWVLRDFALQLVDKAGNEISPKDYLENALMPQKGVSDNVEQKNRIRRYIKHFFKERDCFPLIRPSESEEVLQTLDSASDDMFRPEFATQMAQLRKYVMRRVRIKMLNGKKVTGAMLSSLAGAYIQAINTGSVPNIDTAWNSMCKSECERITQESLGELEGKMRKFQYPEQSATLKETYQKTRDELVSKFRQQAVGPQSHQYESVLKAKLREVYLTGKEANEKAIGVACEKTFAEFYQHSIEKLKAGDYTQLLTFKRDLDAYISGFRKGPLKGVTAEKKLSEFSEKILTDAAESIQRSVNQEAQNQQRRASQMLEMTQMQLTQKKEEFMRETQDLRSRLDKSEKEGHSLKAQILTVSLQLEEHQRDKQRSEERHKERIDDLKRDHTDRNADTKQRLDETLKQLADVQGKHTREVAILEKEKALLEQELKFRKEECEELKAKRVQMESEAKNMRAELRTLRETRGRTANNTTDPDEINSLRSELLEMKEQLQLAQRTMKGTDGSRTPDGDAYREVQRLRAELERVKQQQRIGGNEMESGEYDTRYGDSTRSRSAFQSKDVSFDESSRQRGDKRPPAKQSLDTDKLTTEISALREELELAATTIQQLESRLSDAGNSKELVQKSVGLVCRFCGQVVVHQFFASHQMDCRRDYEAKLAANPDLLLVCIPQTICDRKGEEKFVISLKRRERVWLTHRPFEAFRKLQSSLESVEPRFQFPAFADVLRTASESIYSKARAMTTNEKVKELERYLSAIANSSLGTREEVRQFLG